MHFLPEGQITSVWETCSWLFKNLGRIYEKEQEEQLLDTLGRTGQLPNSLASNNTGGLVEDFFYFGLTVSGMRYQLAFKPSIYKEANKRALVHFERKLE
jgi:hypothetical protein